MNFSPEKGRDERRDDSKGPDGLCVYIRIRQPPGLKDEKKYERRRRTLTRQLMTDSMYSFLRAFKRPACKFPS